MSLITISNDTLCVTTDSCGAVLHSILMEDAEYLWQGDPKYWKRRDANLFPYVGRLTDGCYLLDGQRYEMTIHGFCIGTEFAVTAQTQDSVTFTLEDNETTRAMYPYQFAFHVRYQLDGNRIIKTYTVENRSEREMCFGLGGHPGFQVPLRGEGDFSDWQLRFDKPCQPTRVDIDQATYRLAGTCSPYPLQEDLILPLRHECFDLDAIVLQGCGEAVTLCSPLSSHSVRVEYPGMPFLGLWHAPKTDAPYVCIEPWRSLPSHAAYIEDLATQEHLIHLPSGEHYESIMTIVLQ